MSVILRNSKKKLNYSGFSMVEVLVAGALMVVTMMAIMALLTNLFKQNKALEEKLAILDFYRSITAALSDQTQCNQTVNITNALLASDFTFNASSVSITNPKKIPLKSVLDISRNSPIDLSANRVIIDNIDGVYLDVTSVNGASAMGKLYVNFDQTKLVRAVKSLPAFPIMLSVNGPANATEVLGCISAGKNVLSLGHYRVAQGGVYNLPRGGTSLQVLTVLNGFTNCPKGLGIIQYSGLDATGTASTVYKIGGFGSSNDRGTGYVSENVVSIPLLTDTLSVKVVFASLESYYGGGCSGDAWVDMDFLFY